MSLTPTKLSIRVVRLRAKQVLPLAASGVVKIDCFVPSKQERSL